MIGAITNLSKFALKDSDTTPDLGSDQDKYKPLIGKSLDLVIASDKLAAFNQLTTEESASVLKELDKVSEAVLVGIKPRVENPKNYADYEVTGIKPVSLDSLRRDPESFSTKKDEQSLFVKFNDGFLLTK